MKNQTRSEASVKRKSKVMGLRMQRGRISNPYPAAAASWGGFEQCAENLRSLVSLQYSLNIRDHQMARFLNLKRKERMQKLAADGAEKGGLGSIKAGLAWRGSSREPLDNATAEEIKREWEQLQAGNLEVGYYQRLVDQAGIGAELSESDIFKIFNGAVASTELAAVITTLCKAGSLVRCKGNARYRVTEIVHYIAPLESCTRDWLFGLSRRLVGNTPTPNWGRARFSVTAAEAVQVADFLQSGEVDQITDLSHFHCGGMHNYGALLVMAPVLPRQSEVEAALVGLFQYDDEKRNSVICLSCADLDPAGQREFGRRKAKQAFGKITKKIEHIIQQKPSKSSMSQMAIVIAHGPLTRGQSPMKGTFND